MVAQADSVLHSSPPSTTYQEEICEKLIKLSFVKIVSSKSERGGARLRKNLLILHLLQKARLEQRNRLFTSRNLIVSGHQQPVAIDPSPCPTATPIDADEGKDEVGGPSDAMQDTHSDGNDENGQGKRSTLISPQYESSHGNNSNGVCLKRKHDSSDNFHSSPKMICIMRHQIFGFSSSTAPREQQEQESSRNLNGIICVLKTTQPGDDDSTALKSRSQSLSCPNIVELTCKS